MAELDAVVVGAGPNGLAAAIAIAREGYAVTVLEAEDEIGGGTRTEELTVPGVLHDVCSAIHPLGVGSPFLSQLPLAEHGLRWAHPDVGVAHPLDDGTAGVVLQSLDETVRRLGADGDAWRRTFAWGVERFGPLMDDLLRPLTRVPRHPVALAPVGLQALLPATVVARRFRTEAGKALFGGLAAHAFLPLEAPLTASFGMMLTIAGHAAGWPVAVGGSRSITDAMASYLRSLGGEIHTGVRVRRLSDLPRTRVALLDLTPRQILAIAGDELPGRVRGAYERWRYGPAAFKVDYAVEGAVPWTAEGPRRAGTVHLGGTFDEVAAAEREVAAGRAPQRPFVLVGQQHLADPSRSVGDVHPLWAYAHVPNGYDGDLTDAIDAQIERFAPGFRDRVIARHVWTPAALEAHNSNYVGGDIAGGSHGGMQLLGRPRLATDPYWTGVPGLYLCSSSTPPGAGVHGMCGANAARSALKALRR
ncbi:MAG: NAD(P)/FAD-dependent oxidoreductase [Actinobacteria bacterium]|nr:NAD(P)/FAD-dependent oxidoreductase [Actinomycetota bacterium]